MAQQSTASRSTKPITITIQINPGASGVDISGVSLTSNGSAKAPKAASNGATKKPGRKPSSSKVNPAEVRAWAHATGREVSKRGRIAADLVTEYLTSKK